MDLDHDGKISRDEWIMKYGSDAGFDQYDLDGDGVISPDEWLAGQAQERKLQELAKKGLPANATRSPVKRGPTYYGIATVRDSDLEALAKLDSDTRLFREADLERIEGHLSSVQQHELYELRMDRLSALKEKNNPRAAGEISRLQSALSSMGMRKPLTVQEQKDLRHWNRITSPSRHLKY